MRSNFEFSGAQGCDRVHWQVSTIVQYSALILECPTKLYYILLVCGMHSVVLRSGHTRRQVVATRRGDKSPRQFASCDTVNFVKIIVAAAEFCRCDQSHEFKLV